MNTIDKMVIDKLAAAKDYWGPEREKAVAAYHRGLHAGELDKSPHMRFMSEVCSAVPDLTLRAMYRKQITGERS